MFEFIKDFLKYPFDTLTNSYKPFKRLFRHLVLLIDIARCLNIRLKRLKYWDLVKQMITLNGSVNFKLQKYVYRE
jgi:hypothetical protein